MMPFNRQLEEYLRKEKEEEEKREKQEKWNNQWKHDKATYKALDDAGKSGYDDLTKTNMNLTDLFAKLGNKNVDWTSDLTYGGNKPLGSYYDPISGRLILSADIGSGDALNAIAARNLADKLDASGKYSDLVKYATDAMSPAELAAARDKYKTLYQGLYLGPGKNIDDLVNSEIANEWAQNNLFGGTGSVQKLAYRNPELFAALQDANGSIAKSLDNAAGLGAVRGQYDQVNKIYESAARAAAKSQAMLAGRNPGNAPMPDIGEWNTGDSSFQPQSQAYKDKRNAIINDAALNADNKAKKLRDLDIVYGTYETSLDPTGAYNTKVANSLDDVQSLKDSIAKMDNYNSPMAEYNRKKLQKMMSEINTSAGSNGDYSNPDKLVDMKINNNNIRNAQSSNGTLTGDLDDIVTGFGGKVVWDKTGTQATVYGADGKVMSSLIKNGDQAYEYNKNGKKINTYSTIDGKVQGSFTDYADRMGMPYSYYHDKYGVAHAYVQSDMKDAPIKVTRKENDVYVDANLYFNIVNPEETKKRLIIDKKLDPTKKAKIDEELKKYYEQQITSTVNSILSSWDYDGINASNNDPQNAKEPKKANEYTIDPAGKKLRIHTKLNTGDSLNFGTNNIPKGQNYVTINMDENSWARNHLRSTSHVLTEDPKDLIGRPLISDVISGGDPLRGWKFVGNVLNNTMEAVKTGQMEKALDNWDINKPGQMWLYDPSDAGHEFGHLLGLGDAYGAFYRWGADAPETTTRKNEYGEDQTYTIPLASDLMRGHKNLSDADMAMLLDAWRTGEGQYFDKDPNKMNEVQQITNDNLTKGIFNLFKFN